MGTGMMMMMTTRATQLSTSVSLTRIVLTGNKAARLEEFDDNLNWAAGKREALARTLGCSDEFITLHSNGHSGVRTAQATRSGLTSSRSAYAVARLWGCRQGGARVPPDIVRPETMPLRWHTFAETVYGRSTARLYGWSIRRPPLSDSA
jgi:hypothetical protein